MKSISSLPIFKYLPGSYIIIFLLGIVLALSLDLLPVFPVITLKKLDNIQILELFNGVIWTVMIVERGLEVFIAVWRNGKVIDLEQQIKKYKESKDTEKVLSIKDEISKYKNDTKKIATYTGFIIGIIVSLVGFRVLEPLLEITNITLPQQRAFRILDIILTGLTISGGSNVFHSLISVFTDFLTVTRGKIKDSGKSSDSSEDSSSNK
jgi:hypothetical protein